MTTSASFSWLGRRSRSVESPTLPLQIQDIENGAIQPPTERQTLEDAHERISDNETFQMSPNSTVQTNINNGFSRDEATTENRTFGYDINSSTSWNCMPWVMIAVIFLAEF